ncbi:MAG: hypothetical protein IGR76_07200 [Synechococcales cyanobacterium T60_A2020_003]|nr:hypothetical protein [Synechococcales cyanobacterium T60_A2020_003]
MNFGCVAIARSFIHTHGRPVVNYIHDHWQPGDRLYVFREAKRQFAFYGPKAGFKPEDYILGNQDLLEVDEWSGEALKKYRRDVEALSGQSQLWFLLARKPEADQGALLADLSHVGTQLDTYTKPGALGCLYDMRRDAGGNE